MSSDLPRMVFVSLLDAELLLWRGGKATTRKINGASFFAVNLDGVDYLSDIFVANGRPMGEDGRLVEKQDLPSVLWGAWEWAAR